MNKIFYPLSLFLILAAGVIFGQKKHSGNPIFEGHYADPEAVVLDNEYWIFPTYSALYEQQVFLDAFSSKDLVKWKKHSRILDTASVKWAKIAMWAPSVIKKGQDYFLFFAANDIQNDQEYGGIGIAVSKKPEGPYKDYLGKPLIDKFHNKAQPIDQFVFKDGADYYIIYGGWKHCNIAKLNADFTDFIPFENGEIFKEITPKNYVEGPFMFKKKDLYYFMWSEGGWTGPDYSVAYATSKSPFGPFERKAKILEQDDKIARGAGHHSLIQNGKKWYIVYHRRPLDTKARDARVTCIERLHFKKNGEIKPVKMTFKGVKRQRI